MIDIANLLQTIRGKKKQQEERERKQKEVLSRLAEEEKDIQQKLIANTTAFSGHLSNFKGVQKEVAEKNVMPDVKLLMDIKSVLHCCDNLKPPAIYWCQLRREEFSLPPQCSALQKIIEI
ncbi:Tripartite motif-containing protein 75 [Myotis brandtii]|uniref:Tripartite motif-containing protein 75 n=1 Tax=Myotis brandtii TaxID=109478 RepID=S7PXQ7_MYOBR|nr:Tripartite motif-containing protein 75 [Myotis brandtii]